MAKNSALLLVDLQNDFCKGGALAVPESDAVIALANNMMSQFKFVIASQDWHPEGHSSFEYHWPPHCIQNTWGAAFHPDLNIAGITKVIQKGVDLCIDSYSAFYANDHLTSTGLTQYLHQHNITHLVVMGLTTEYCVKFTCLDALTLGFDVTLFLPGCRGLSKPDIEKALKEMQAAGALLQEDL